MFMMAAYMYMGSVLVVCTEATAAPQCMCVLHMGKDNISVVNTSMHGADMSQHQRVFHIAAYRHMQDENA